MLPVLPEPDRDDLTSSVHAVDHNGDAVSIMGIVERPLTIYLNSQEIVTVMTICDYPEYLALGYLLNQSAIPKNSVSDISTDYDEETATVVIRTTFPTSFEDKMRKKTQTSGCSVGTVYGDILEEFDKISFPDHIIHTSTLYALSKQINTLPTLYLKAGAIHGCVLCKGNNIQVFMEDIGRHNAVDKIAGYMFSQGLSTHDSIFYTTGRLTSEMVIKAAIMGIPVVFSRSGFTVWAAELAAKVGMTLISRFRGKRFVCVAGGSRVVFDT